MLEHIFFSGNYLLSRSKHKKKTLTSRKSSFSSLCHLLFNRLQTFLLPIEACKFYQNRQKFYNYEKWFFNIFSLRIFISNSWNVLFLANWTSNSPLFLDVLVGHLTLCTSQIKPLWFACYLSLTDIKTSWFEMRWLLYKRPIFRKKSTTFIIYVLEKISASR
jgi:hypothetical protein